MNQKLLELARQYVEDGDAIAANNDAIAKLQEDNVRREQSMKATGEQMAMLFA